MEFFSADNTRLNEVRPEIMSMKKYFDTAKHFPKYLITQNKPVMKKAFEIVPAAIWADRVCSLQDALWYTRGNDLERRIIITTTPSGMTTSVDKVLDIAFLDKYEELMIKVLHDFKGFWPYEITRSNRDLLVFEKMNNMRMVEYVLERTS